jgi:hypothetical protein
MPAPVCGLSRGDRANLLTGSRSARQACGERKIVVGTDDSKIHFMP